MDRKFKIDGINAPWPNIGMKISIEDVCDEATGRNMGAMMDKKTIAQKTTINCDWSCLPDEKCSKLLKLTKTKEFVDVTYCDPYEGRDVTKTFYTNTPNTNLVVCVNNKCFWNVSMTFIEK